MGEASQQPTGHMGINFTSTIHHDSYPAINSSSASPGIEGKQVFITGASRGLGKAMALAYAKAGASVIGVSARSELEDVARDIRSATTGNGRPEPKFVTVAMDVASEASVCVAVDKVAKEFDGHLDILVNNAGYMEMWHSIMEVDLDDWWKS